MRKETKYDLPVGYFDFHKKQVYNFQFNRWHSVGFARFEDMKEAGERINNFFNISPSSDTCLLCSSINFFIPFLKSFL